MSKENFKFMRGGRVIQSLEETTLVDLERNIVFGFPETEKRQHATKPVQITQMKLTPYRNSTDLLADATAKSNESGKTYQPKVLFLDVEFQNEDTPENVTFTGSDGDNYNIIPVSLSHSNVKVKCDCLDFHHRFAGRNDTSNALIGNPPKMDKPVPGSNRPPVNPKKVPGLCKHLIKTVQAMKDAGLVKD